MPEAKRPLKVFLCHASADKPKVRELYRTLKRRGVQPWLDAENLIPGQNWEVEIPKALLSSDAIIICLSPNSVDKEGYVQKEIKFALDKALEMPEGRIFLIPARLEDCELPFSLRQYQAVNLYDKEGYTKLMKALKLRASQLERNTVELPKEADVVPEIKKVIEEKRSVEPKQEKRETKTFDSSYKSLWQGVDVSSNVNNLGKQEISEPVKPEEKIIERPKSKVEKPELKKTKSPYKWNTAIIVALIGLAGTIIAALLGSPIIEKWFPPAPVSTESATATITMTSQPIIPSKTIEPSQTPTEISAPTVTPLPTEITDTKGVSMMLVPAGEFTMGSDNGRENEKPAHNIYLDSYYIDKYEVTNALYKQCVEVDVCQPPEDLYVQGFWPTDQYYGTTKYSSYPVVYVNWEMSKTYCEWRGARLPTEAEWEKTARGPDNHTYPWGNTTGKSYANYNTRFPAPVGLFEKGKSFYDVYNLAGNVWEWVSSLDEPYPYNSNDGRENAHSPGIRIVRGGAWTTSDISSLQTTFRYGRSASKGQHHIGFRCANDATP